MSATLMQSRAPDTTREASRRAVVDRWQRALELVCRTIAIVALVWSAVQVARGTLGVERTSAGDALPRALPAWTVAPPAAAHLVLTRVPDAAERDWLRALRRDGMRIDWRPGRGSDLVPTALGIEPVADPAGEREVTVAAPSGVRVRLGDALGVLDSSVTRAGGATFWGVPRGPVSASIGQVAAPAIADVADSLLLRPVLVVGDVGWESKFIARALEERGWPVDVRFGLRPGVPVRSAGAPMVDTAHYAAIVFVGSASGVAAATVGAYVHSGGGLVLAGGAERAVPQLSVGGGGRTIAPEPTFPDSAPRRGLELVPIVGARAGSVVLESRAIEQASNRTIEAAVVMARVDSGRVIQVGYRDTWRWRMEGAGNTAEDHRAWWASLVSRVAYAPAVRRETGVVDPAPLASWMDVAGSRTTAARPRAWTLSLRLLFAITLIGLLGEWISRRSRGVR